MFKTGKRTPRPPEGGGTSLRRRAGVFVSLHQDGCLRGCVGHKWGRERLTAAVPLLALSAALDDTRFKPLRACETDIEIEISILSPLKRVRDGARFRLGLHWALYRVRVRPGGCCCRRWPTAATGPPKRFLRPGGEGGFTAGRLGQTGRTPVCLSRSGICAKVAALPRTPA